MPLLRAEALAKHYAGTPALTGFSHPFAAGRITTVLGPSGSGKSTLLGLLAGLLPPDGGRLFLDEQEITHRAAERRDFGMVFQNYALFPHLTVAENVEFPLRVRHRPRSERARQVGEALERLRIPHLAGRRIQALSGGEQQRVAIARAMAFRPLVLLLDEPLSALDAQLRETLRGELAPLLRELGITTIYVTHDQGEALSLGDELLILRAGRIEQSGTPAAIYRQPATPFVASFLGAANVIPGECGRGERGAEVRLPMARLPCPEQSEPGPCWAVLRPEDLEPVDDPAAAEFTSSIESIAFLGSRLRLEVRAAGFPLVVETGAALRVASGATLFLRVRPGRIVILPRPN